MSNWPLDPDVADVAPADASVTAYDEHHVITYMRLLQAEGEKAEWQEIARLFLRVDPEREPDRARKAYESHLARARWITEITENGRLLRLTQPKQNKSTGQNDP